MKKFDFCIGNPPYQSETDANSGNQSYSAPIYNDFMDAAYQVANKVELVHPARFLFDAGSTPKVWNKKMLADKHFKVLHYEADTKKMFDNVAITGGVVISYHDNNKDFGEIGVFTQFPLLNSIYKKTVNYKSFQSMEPIVITRTIYRLTTKMHEDPPEARYKEDENGKNIGCLSKGHDYDMASNIFERLPQIFFTTVPNDGHEYIRMLGRLNNQRTYMFLRRDYATQVANLDKYKVILAKADGAAGTIGNPIPARVTGVPSVEGPATGTTESFISIGSFNTEAEAINAQKYVKTKFARTLLSLLKVTQEINPQKWKYVPLQDFTPNSDINWNTSIHNIDLQLYKKYGLTQEEIDFIETHVKEME